MKSKDKRKSRRQREVQPESPVEHEEETSVVEKIQYIEDPCPVCGLSEMRQVVGGGKICPLCEAERKKADATARAGFRSKRRNVLVDYFIRDVRRWIHC